jgi:hypothetical protein
MKATHREINFKTNPIITLLQLTSRLVFALFLLSQFTLTWIQISLIIIYIHVRVLSHFHQIQLVIITT